MILNALVEHYETLAAKDRVPRPGWGLSKVSFALSLLPDGSLQQVFSTLHEVKIGKKTELRPIEMNVPEPVKRTVGIMPNFLCDNTAYLLSIDRKGKPERALSCFEAAKEMHIRLLKDVDSDAARAVVAFFSTWDPVQAEEHPALADAMAEIKRGGNLIFRVAARNVHEDEAVRTAWEREAQRPDGRDAVICSVTGERAMPARLHPAIKGVRGAQSSGASLVSFNAEAYNSFDKEQGMNAPVGERAAFAYGAALNYLLSDTKHCVQLGDTTVVFWAKGGQDVLADMMVNFVTDYAATINTELMAAMHRLGSGLSVQWEEQTISPDVQFYILGVSPNAARISVRFFLRDSFGAFAKRLMEHQERIQITRPSFDQREELTIWALLRETINPNSREKKPESGMAGDLIRAVLTGGRYPATLLNGVLLRIRADREITRGRAAILKAFYLRNSHPDCPKEVLTVSLNDSKNIPHLLGQLFSVLEGIQQSANPGINTTIKDKYFNSASATPAKVFPTLINLSHKHLRKLNTGMSIYYEKELTRLMVDIGEDFPARMSLPAQGSFQLGYYFMTQKRYTKKEDNANV